MKRLFVALFLTVILVTGCGKTEAYEEEVKYRLDAHNTLDIIILDEDEEIAYIGETELGKPNGYGVIGEVNWLHGDFNIDIESYGHYINGEPDSENIAIWDEDDELISNSVEEFNLSNGLYIRTDDLGNQEWYYVKVERGNDILEMLREQYSGESVYKRDIEGSDYLYVGELKENRTHGIGKLYIPMDKDLWRLTYSGEFTDGQINNIGTTFYYNGQVQYNGSYELSKRDGTGVKYDVDGKKMYEGTWASDEYSGEGTLFRENGSIEYEGEWKNGRKNGKGKLYYEDGTLEYDGQFQGDDYDGTGKLYFEDGSIWYDGEWKDGERHGMGTLYEEDGSIKYEGEWVDDDIK